MSLKNNMVVLKVCLLLLFLVGVTAARMELSFFKSDQSSSYDDDEYSKPCCDLCMCTRSMPPQCSCEDIRLNSCHSDCKSCYYLALPRRGFGNTSEHKIHTCLTYNPGPEFLKNSIRVKPDLDGLGALGDTVLGTKGCLRLHDFALPFEESLGHGKFLEASELDYGKIEPGMWCPKPNEHVVETGFSQDALMVKEFADLVQKVKGCEMKPEKTWPVLSRKQDSGGVGCSERVDSERLPAC
ncbi:Bowman-Birk type proteinase inhibitor D-II [Glycine soja]|uniref:Bowman-Birk type proteinase inhibitor D-II n=1 Tax=Glycine soja TaxID=3848 RepID=A0A445GL66_GLYSO|nr:Bowman-Birk type proteinase inhibitor D-II [Glycine soja]